MSSKSVYHSSIIFFIAEQSYSQENGKTFNEFEYGSVPENRTAILNASNYISFPYNLKSIKEALDVLENEDCVRDTVTVFEAMTRHESWALESKF